MRMEKYHGLGNDYLVFDSSKNKETMNSGMAMKLCDRHFGFGADGILEGGCVTESGTKGTGFRLRIYNPDGSEAEKSGNGVRIFARYLKDAEYVNGNEVAILTKGGTVKVKYLDDMGDNMEVLMGRLSFASRDVGVIGIGDTVIDKTVTFGKEDMRCTCVSVGNPHCVILLDEVSKERVCRIARHTEYAKCFQNGVNTQIVKILDRNNIQIEIFERGAGYTLSSGTGGCAAAGAMYRIGLVDSDVNVHMPGGILRIHITKDLDVYMTGTVEKIGSVFVD